MKTMPATPHPSNTLRVRSVDADEGLIWALLDGDDRLVGTAAARVWEPISPADAATAELELWVAPGADVERRWTLLTDEVLPALRLLEVERILANAAGEDGDRLRRLLAAGFRVVGVSREGVLRLELA